MSRGNRENSKREQGTGRIQKGFKKESGKPRKQPGRQSKESKGEDMKKIIFLGDSITDAHHNLGVDAWGLGDGYVQMIARKLKEQEENVKILNRGHDGFTVQGLLRLLPRDCILKKPDVVSILVGCNDVGIMMNTGRSLREQGFAENYERLLTEIQEGTDAKIICMGPFIFPYPQEYQNWIPGILEAERMIREASERHRTVFIPLYGKMRRMADTYGYEKITVDGIHLTESGNEVIADMWLEKWNE